MTNKELFYFAGRCLMLDENPEFSQTILAEIKADRIDWKKFTGLCSNHLIQPLVYQKFRKHGLLSHLPNDLSEFLAEIFRINTERNQEILAQAAEITATLNAAGIYPVFLKGTGNLISGLYENIGERILTDIDFLVAGSEYQKSAELFINEEYRIERPFYIDVDKTKHFPGLAKTGKPAPIEIHRMLTEGKHRRWFNRQITDREKQAVPGLPGCFVLSDEHNLIYNFLHSQIHHQGSLYGIVSLRDLYDFYLIAQKVSTPGIPGKIKCRRNAIAYFKFAGKVFGNPNRYYPQKSFQARIFILKHDLNLSSRLFYHLFRTVAYLTDRILIGGSRQIFRSVFSKEMRRSVFARITDPKWYGLHIKSYFDFFRPNK